MNQEIEKKLADYLDAVYDRTMTIAEARMGIGEAFESVIEKHVANFSGMIINVDALKCVIRKELL
jgi:hypothetical protein